MYWINLLNRVDIVLSIQLFYASTGPFESKHRLLPRIMACTKCVNWHRATKEHECHWPPPEIESSLCTCVSQSY